MQILPFGCTIRLTYKQKVRPARAVTHPLQSSKKTITSAKKSEALDVDELFRRLERHRQHIEDARERRRAKTVKKASSDEYHHVPQSAATDFVRTTTPDVRSRKSIHPLSRPVVQTQSLRSRSEGHMVTTRMPLSQVVQDRDLSELNMLLNAERNQFTQTGAFARATEVDKERNIFKLPQRDFEFSQSKSMSNRTISMGDQNHSLSERRRAMTEGRIRPKSYLPTFDEWDKQVEDVLLATRPHHVQNHTKRRHDWSQNETAIAGDGYQDKDDCRNLKTSTPVSRFFDFKTQVQSKDRTLNSENIKAKPLPKRRFGFLAALFHRGVQT